MRTLAPASLIALCSALSVHVTPRFQQCLTVWEANGQWQQSNGRISQECAKVLLLVHDETPAVRAKLRAVIESYRKGFQQESVLWESARVCAAF